METTGDSGALSTREAAREPRTRWMRAIAAAEIPPAPGVRLLALAGNTIALFSTENGLFAVDNRCPHMGFPLDRGTVKDCILTCHWHHARFDLKSGGTFDQWADDVRVFPVRVVDGDVMIDLGEPDDRRAHLRRRLGDGLERDISLVIAKSVIALLDGGDDAREPFRAGLEFGVSNRREGWGAGLTTLTCMANLLPFLDPRDRPLALYHGLASVASDTDGHPPRFAVHPLPGAGANLERLKGWLRRFVEVRDSEGAERCITTAVRTGAAPGDLAAMMFAAATDHRYLSIGHAVDFTNKAFEALAHGTEDLAEPVLASLARAYATGDRMEESNAWRNPVDLVAICERAFEALPAALATSGSRRPRAGSLAGLGAVILGDDPDAIAEAMLAALREGVAPVDLAREVALAAATRIERFHISNEFGDWDTAHHSFTFACAVYQAMARAPSPELLRAAFDAAMSVYLNRFLNIPAATIRAGAERSTRDLLEALPALFDRQQQVDPVAATVAQYCQAGGAADALIAALGHALLREDRDFHSIQNLEAALHLYSSRGETQAGADVLIATSRYMAAHSPTVRAQGQTWRIATRLHRGERLFEESQP